MMRSSSSLTTRILDSNKNSKQSLKSATSRGFSRRFNVGDLLVILKLIFVAEFNHFSKNFVEKAPKPKTDGLKDFLNLFD